MIMFYLFFKRLERGEIVDDGDAVLNTGEARDDISMLPRPAAIKIFSYLSIIDLSRCAQVCRSWKIITNSNVLWSKVKFKLTKLFKLFLKLIIK